MTTERWGRMGLYPAFFSWRWGGQAPESGRLGAGLRAASRAPPAAQSPGRSSPHSPWHLTARAGAGLPCAPRPCAWGGCRGRWESWPRNCLFSALSGVSRQALGGAGALSAALWSLPMTAQVQKCGRVRMGTPARLCGPAADGVPPRWPQEGLALPGPCLARPPSLSHVHCGLHSSEDWNPFWWGYSFLPGRDS